ncbi:MAG: amidase [Dehalococcoidia bacterium]
MSHLASPLAHAPLAATAEGLRSGVLSLEAYINDACDRLDQFEPRVRAVLPEPGRRERLLDEARALRARHPDLLTLPPLFGVLVGAKDIFAVDAMPTRAGSALPPEAFAMPEAPAVSRLKAAGALILGKTVSTEFAYFDPGATTNPHRADRTPGGSSSGSAAAVACGYAALALGSQTVGSLIRPAAYCGVVAFKPSYGRIPTEGVVAYSPSVDHVGFFTQDVAGARLAASVLVNGWSEGPARPGLPVLGVPEGPYLEQAEPEALQAFELTVAGLMAGGVDVRRVRILDDIATVNARHAAIATAEFGEQHAERFAQYGPLYRAASAALFDAAQAVSAGDRLEGFASREALRHRLDTAAQEEGIDAWVSPAARGPAPVGLRSTGDPVMNLPWTHAGLPAITVPAGNVDGMPLGLQMAGRFGGDEALFDVAEALLPLLAS